MNNAFAIFDSLIKEAVQHPEFYDVEPGKAVDFHTDVIAEDSLGYSYGWMTTISVIGDELICNTRFLNFSEDGWGDIIPDEHLVAVQKSHQGFVERFPFCTTEQIS